MSEFTGQLREYEALIPDFQGKIDAISSRSLTPENINTYADDALDDLVSVAQEATATYDHQPTIDHGNGTDHERAAFSYLGLNANNIETMLDHIADKSDEIRSLDEIMRQISLRTDKVITPPNSGETTLTTGNGSFGERQHIDRLKTLLFVLTNAFDVDISNVDECTILTGKVTNEMIRNEPYHLVTLPTINREALVCDEEGNVTYVFDSEKLKSTGVLRDVLVDMVKDSINQLLGQHPGIGYRLPYSKLFTEKISSLLEHIPEQDKNIAIDADSGKFLGRNEIPDGFQSMNATAKEIKATTNVTRKAIEELGDLLGDIATARFSNGIRAVYSPEQQALIKGWLNENGYLVPEAPEGYASIHKISEIFSVSDGTIDKAINELGDELGNVVRARFGSNRTRVYSPEQQSMIREILEEKNIIGVPMPEEEYLTLTGLNGEFGVDQSTLAIIIARNVDEIGKPTMVRAGVRTVSGYSPDQVKIITSLLEQGGHLSALAPEGYLSKTRFAEGRGYSRHAVNKAVATMSDLGDTITARVKAGKATQISEVYSTEQQDKIALWLEENVYSTPEMPEEYVSTKQFANDLSVADTTIRKAVDELGPELGSIMHARVHSKTSDVYSPQQQLVIRDWLTNNGYTAKDGFENYLTQPAIARELGISATSLQKITQKNANHIGEPAKIRTDSRSSVNGYSPEQQKIILELVQEANLFAVETPDGYIPRQQLVDQTGYSKFAIMKAIEELDDDLGQIITTRTGNQKAHMVYSPEQQANILEWLQVNGYKPTTTAIGSLAMSADLNNSSHKA